MFISKIHIKDHNQFQDLELDLTYPLGHEKAGQPLDKVCIIGQSGTGKTTLLEEVWEPSKETGAFDNGNEIIKKVKIVRTTSKVKNINIFYETTRTIRIKTRPVKTYFHINNVDNISEPKFYSFSLYSVNSGWEKLQKAIEKHQQEKAKYSFAISKAFISNNLVLAGEHKLALENWESENETPLNDLAIDYLNPILKDFGLEVKTELESLEQISQIHLVNKNLETIPYEYWSSGIKNIIARTIPLYSHKFSDAIICIDEPENSLYPDIQRKIVNLYTRLAPNSQFFFATHSPIIASSFEPWEIVELKLDDKGSVYREQYWEGENHVDNYKYYPQYLRWDAILQHIFDLENDGSDMRKDLLQEFANLDNKLKARKNKGEELSKDDPEVKELLEMGKKLGWNTK